mmetsp:Transcript_14541/g.31649  ORF Transcript_14541/g.31649 Transcript_14541/m.31649 type:complete len:677 (+) Transcript_14541:102-2132(+)|eukprot:CAMPEP_0202907656 /NCGR_PEP_ID=MMETSP1392-20130828/43396_1 /ASSEMBLY_ACC=CAM_ASM_000868 /TAXON_ID=225041 /ORGANISM="Chlamydomonas chlamydogama, Strain SAG 11-48b" /LENGTH=676 /DNA_ID=CAMNT_0049596663 /DNA_START=60 /DNA_END=2090 /DNA_ORIENTATION=+
MATGVVFLQSNVDESAGKNVGNYKPGNTDVIRTMLREQQKECTQLHANALFREFRGEGQKQKKFGKGYVVQAEGNQPMFDDFQAEGQSRMFELIKQIAVKEEKPLKGVWASFGKPYVCLGDPEELVQSAFLPKLNRDEIANQEGKGMGRGGRKGRVPQGPTAPEPQRQVATASSIIKRKTTANSQGSPSDSSMKPGELEEMQLTRNKSVMRFAGNDLVEVKFPEGPLKTATHRLLKSMAKPGAFVNQFDAEDEISDPALAYGQPVVPARRLDPIKAQRGDDGDDGKSAVFITQGAEDAQSGVEHSRQSYAGISEAGSRFTRDHSLPGRAKSQQDAGGVLGTPETTTQEVVGSLVPEFKPVVEKAVPARGEEDNPVYNWHNKFVEVRHRGRNNLQQALYERAEGRYKARTTPAMTANLSSILMADLDLVQGKKVPYASVGVKPTSPYLKMEATWAAQEENRKVRTQRAQTLDPEELRVLQRFYDQLCALVEAQRMSDPLSLMVIHKVKSLLESGTFLQKSMLQQVMDHISRFCKSCGLVRYNKFMLSVLTFISKCVGVGEPEFEEMVGSNDLAVVVFGTVQLPSKAAAEASPGGQDGSKTARSAKAGRMRSLSRNMSFAAANKAQQQATAAAAIAAAPAGAAGDGMDGEVGGEDAAVGEADPSGSHGGAPPEQESSG